MSFKPLKIILYIGILFLLFPKPAHAYLDPGTGSYFFQVLIAGLLGSLFFIKTIFRRVKNFFSGIKEGKNNRANEDK